MDPDEWPVRYQDSVSGVFKSGSGSIRAWFQDEIGNAILSVRRAMLATRPEGEYRRGILDATRAIATTFGIELPVEEG